MSEATYDPTTELGELRLMLQDTNTDDPIFTDKELQVIMSKHGDLNMAASMGWSIIAGDKSRKAKIKRSGNYSHNLRQIARECREQANYYKELAQESPAIDYTFKG